jgi:2-keto-4-pentenoate hydratase/2-oxohepta-3-ene-1,7-dioic acid hydratase in catechol pathway
MFSPKGTNLERGWPGRVDGDRIVQLAAQTLQAFFTGGGGAREHAEYPLAEVDLRAPVLHPPGIRIFTEGLDFVFGNTAAVYGPDDDVPHPAGSSDLRYEPAVVAVLGAEGVIGGFTGGIAWHAPDLPGAKSRDFALSIGPIVVTPDEYADAAWDARLAHASGNTRLRPGELLVASAGPSQPVAGDRVQVELDGIGTLVNRIVA